MQSLKNRSSVGKFIPHAARMSGGVGFAELTLKNGVTVLAYAVVNSLGDVRDYPMENLPIAKII